MGAYFRVAPRFGVYMPWWLIPIAFFIWLSLAFIYWFMVALFWLTVQACLLVAMGWRWWRDRQAA